MALSNRASDPARRVWGRFAGLAGLLAVAGGLVLLEALGGLVAWAVLLDLDWGTWQTGVDPWPFVTAYLGLALAGAMFLALGLFVSSLVRSQMVAALIALFLSLVFIVAGFWRPEMDTGSTPYQVLFFFTVPLHFERNFSRGLVDTRQLVLYGSVTLFCLFMTVRSLESRRWR